MKKTPKFILYLLLSFVVFGSISGCTASADTNPETTPETTASENDPFSIDVIPLELKGFSIPGQRCVFLVRVKDDASTGQLPVTITASASDAQIIIENEQISPDQIAEVTVIPNADSQGKTIAVTFTGTRGTVQEQASISFEVIEWEDDRADTASALQQKFIAWLAENHPELGIDQETEWIGTIVSPQWLVVSHYLFFSDEWEMHVSWHIMIAPDDWGRIDLRRRFTEDTPSYAYEISSLDADSEPAPIEIPNEIWR